MTHSLSHSVSAEGLLAPCGSPFEPCNAESSWSLRKFQKREIFRETALLLKSMKQIAIMDGFDYLWKFRLILTFETLFSSIMIVISTKSLCLCAIYDQDVMFVPRTALAASDREGRIKLLTATGFTPDQQLYTTMDHVLYPTYFLFLTISSICTLP